jgi:hypothetical protein
LNEGKAKNPYKSPTNDRHILKNRRQTIEELNSYDWENASGIGVVLGFNNLRAIDFDFERLRGDGNNQIILNDFCRKVLELLNLPAKYEWVTYTPNDGLHILFYCDDHPFKVKENLTKAFTPNENWCYLSNDLDYLNFTHLELRWNKHLMLSPSRIEYYKFYRFRNNHMPKFRPRQIEITNLINMLDELCCQYGIYKNESPKSYNTFWAGHYQFEPSHDFLVRYGFDEYLDFKPVYLDSSDFDQNNPDEWIK